MKKLTIRQYGVGDDLYTQVFVVEIPDDVDPALLNEDALGRLADEGEVEWKNDDSWDVMTLSDHEVLDDIEPTDGLPVYKWGDYEDQQRRDCHKLSEQVEWRKEGF